MPLPKVKPKSPGKSFSSSHYLPHHTKKPQTQIPTKCRLMHSKMQTDVSVKKNKLTIFMMKQVI